MHNGRRISKLAIAGVAVGPVYVGLVILIKDRILHWSPILLEKLIYCALFAAPIVGMIISIVALVRIQRSGGMLGGERLARLGRDLNFLIILFWIFLIYMVLPSIS